MTAENPEEKAVGVKREKGNGESGERNPLRFLDALQIHRFPAVGYLPR